MADIKIKETAKTVIKTAEKAGIVSDKVKEAGIKTKDGLNEAAENKSGPPEQYAVDKVQEKTKSAADTAAYAFNRQGRKSVGKTKDNIQKAKSTLEEVRERRAAKKKSAKGESGQSGKSVKTGDGAPIRKAGNAPKQADNAMRAGGASVKVVENEAKASAKVGQTAVQTKNFAVTKTAEKTRKATRHLKDTVRKAEKAAKAFARALSKTIKIAYEAGKSLATAMIAGGWISVVVILLLCLVGAVAGSFYGIFFSTETSSTGMNITSAIQQINAAYDDKINAIKAKSTYDSVEISGSKANWKDVLSVYSVKVSTDPNNPQETATMDESKMAILSDIFWDMNSIVSSVQTRTDEQNASQTILVITLSGKTAYDMANAYAFDEQQKQYLVELMSDSNDKLWASIIYNVGSNTSGIDIGSLHFENETANDTQKKIVAVATNSEYYGISASSGYCQAWVADVYQAVTGSRGHAHCALCAAEQWAVSGDWSKIPVATTVYGYASNPYGHVGIYIGNGQVAHNLSGEIVIQSLDSWVSQFKGFAWGWESGKNLIT